MRFWRKSKKKPTPWTREAVEAIENLSSTNFELGEMVKWNGEQLWVIVGISTEMGKTKLDIASPYERGAQASVWWTSVEKVSA